MSALNRSQAASVATPRAWPTPKGSVTFRKPSLVLGLRSPSSAASQRCRGALTCTAAKQKFGSFGEMLQQSDLVLVDFYATWCGPCHMMSQIMSEVSRSMKDRVSFVKIDTEKYPSLASQYQVSALPTLVLFKDGKVLKRVEGVLAAPDLKRWLEQSVAAATK